MLEPPTLFNNAPVNQKPAHKEHVDVIALFAEQDRVRALWGRPYEGPVKNTKHQEQLDVEAT